jgi:putative flippase GtrA
VSFVQSLVRHVPRYTVVGALCAGLYNVIMIAGDRLGAHYVASTAVAFVLIVAVGYTLHCLYTFSEKMSWMGVVRYTGAMLLTLPMSLGGMFVLRDLAHVPMWIASPLLTVLMFAYNFLAARWAVLTRALGGKKAEARP